MIDERHDIPVRCDMAVRTFTNGRNVVRGFRRSANQASLRMAAGTIGCRRSECAADMATFTGDARMSAVQYESCAEVIEGLLRPCSGGCKQQNEQYGDE